MMYANVNRAGAQVYAKGQFSSKAAQKDFSRVENEISRTADQASSFNETSSDKAKGNADVVQLEGQREKFSGDRIIGSLLSPETLTGSSRSENGQLKELDIRKDDGTHLKYLETDDAKILHEERYDPHPWSKDIPGLGNSTSITYRQDKKTGTICSLWGQDKGLLTPEDNFAAMADPAFDVSTFKKDTEKRFADAHRECVTRGLQNALNMTSFGVAGSLLYNFGPRISA